MEDQSRHASTKGGTIGWVISILFGLLAAGLLAWAAIAYLIPVQPQPQPDILNGDTSLFPSVTVAKDQINNFAVTTGYAQIVGEEFEFSAADHSLPDFDASIVPYFNASGKISSSAYLDTELGILYLDYGVSSADCLTYLTLDLSQTGTAEAEPLGGIVTAGNGIHSVPYPYDHAPSYITVAGVVCVNNAYFYFKELHRQDLNVVTGTTQELAQMGIGSSLEMLTREPVALDGIWITVAQPMIAEDEDHSYIANAGYYKMSADGNFTYTPVTLGKQGVWYHMGGGEESYEGTYQYDGITMKLHYTIYNEAYFDENLGCEATRAVEIDQTEEFPMQINQSCAEMCAVIPQHPTLDQLLFFEKCKSDDPINAMLIQINSRF